MKVKASELDIELLTNIHDENLECKSRKDSAGSVAMWSLPNRYPRRVAFESQNRRLIVGHLFPAIAMGKNKPPWDDIAMPLRGLERINVNILMSA